MDPNLLGQILLNFNLVTREQLERAVEAQRQQRPPRLLGEILLEQKAIDEKSLRSILTIQKRRFEAARAPTRTSAPSESDLRARLKQAPAVEFLKVARELGASDLYLSTGHPPLIRLHGQLLDLPADPLPFEEGRKLLFTLLTKEQIDAYYARKSVDVLLEVPDAGRFRTSVFRHLKGIAGNFRVIPDRVTPFDKLGLPPSLRDLTQLGRGLVLVTGPAGCGKTTTLASLVDLINRSQPLHILTIEDPIEIVFESDRSLISQRQVPTHSRSFASALHAGLREDPDVIVLGEMRDAETVSTALTAAETGHLIFATMHTHNAHRTVLRILDQFPAQKRDHARAVLAGVLRAVVSQQLVPNLDGRGRSLAYEIMIVNAAISNLIREDRAWQIPMVIQTSRKAGMRLMDDSLLELVQRKKIALEEAVARAADRTRFVTPEAVRAEA